MSETKTDRRGGKRIPGPGKKLGPKPKPAEERKVRLQIHVAPDLARWLNERAEGKRGAVSQYVERLIQQAEIKSRIL